MKVVILFFSKFYDLSFPPETHRLHPAANGLLGRWGCAITLFFYFCIFDLYYLQKNCKNIPLLSYEIVVGCYSGAVLDGRGAVVPHTFHVFFKKIITTLYEFSWRKTLYENYRFRRDPHVCSSNIIHLKSFHAQIINITLKSNRSKNFTSLDNIFSKKIIIFSYELGLGKSLFKKHRQDEIYKFVVQIFSFEIIFLLK
jgi:hypothetical protein